MKKLIIILVLPLMLGCKEDILWIHLDPNTNQLLDPCNEPIILRGVNKMVIFDGKDPFGEKNFKEIAQTNANCLRIAWGTARDNDGQIVPTTAVELDSVISKCISNQMIPIIG